ncbi:MAG: thiamine pyrophosphate-binding protein [Maricaulaceae bacterium]
MGPNAPARTGGQIVVDALSANGVERVFGVPGESYLGVLDALYDSKIDFVVTRHEAGAANMAEAVGKLTGRPGVALVTRGPGATHAGVGVHTAFQDSTPMVLCVGQAARGMLGREAFQELDYTAVFGGLAKAVVTLDTADRAAERLNHAFRLAMSGRPGPVVVVLPEDLLGETTHAPAPVRVAPARPGPDPGTLAALEARLKAARAPLFLAGGPGWTLEAVAALHRVSDKTGLPVATSFRAKARFDNHHPHYAGDLGIGANPDLVARLRASDCLLVVGPRLGEMTTAGYQVLQPPIPRVPLIHVHPDPNELGRVYAPSLAICADVATFMAAFEGLDLPTGAWIEAGRAARAAYDAWTRPLAASGPGVNLADVVDHVTRTLGPDAIVCNGAGNYAGWVHRFHHHRRYPSQLAPTSGAMGYGLPAAIAAKLTHPDRDVIAFAGDGCFMMASPEFATAVQHSVDLTVIVVDNSGFGTIRMHQERAYPGRVIGTDLRNPDFAAFARACGGWGASVTETASFASVWAEARAIDGPALIHVRTDLEQIAPGKTLSAVRGFG